MGSRRAVCALPVLVLVLTSASAFSPLVQRAHPDAPGGWALCSARLALRGRTEARCHAEERRRGAAGAVGQDDGGSRPCAGEADRLWVWARKRGICLPSAQIGEKNGLRGVLATGAGLSPGDTIVRLPRSSTMCVGCIQMRPFPSHISPSFWEQSSMSVRLALLLLHEVALGPRSPFAEWLAALPRSHEDKPVTWSQSEVAELQDETLAELVSRQRDTIHRVYESLRQYPEHVHITRADWWWAMHTVSSRSFMGEVEGRRETLLDRIIVALLLKARSAFPEIISIVPPALRRWADGTRSSSSLLLLEPMVDMLNHQTLAAAETTLDPTTDELTVKTLETWDAGEEIRIDYAGAKSNAKLLLSYGFVEDNNPRNTAYLTETELLSAAERVHKEDTMVDAIAEQEWQQAVALLKAHNFMQSTTSGLCPAEVSARGMSERCSAFLRVLLCMQDERAGLNDGMCDETERRVARAVAYACQDAISAYATTVEEDQAILRELPAQDKDIEALRLKSAVQLVSCFTKADPSRGRSRVQEEVPTLPSFPGTIERSIARSSQRSKSPRTGYAVNAG